MIGLVVRISGIFLNYLFILFIISIVEEYTELKIKSKKMMTTMITI